jgi:hypothetical protein
MQTYRPQNLNMRKSDVESESEVENSKLLRLELQIEKV